MFGVACGGPAVAEAAPAEKAGAASAHLASISWSAPVAVPACCGAVDGAAPIAPRAGWQAARLRIDLAARYPRLGKARFAAISDAAAPEAEAAVRAVLQPSAELEAVLAGDIGSSGATRDALWREAPAAGIARPRALAFADRYQRGADLGPELERLRRFVEDCAALGALPTVQRICGIARRDFGLPSDLDARIRGLEQLSRNTVPLVVRLGRQHLGEASANPGDDGKPREIGLDLNHGRNVGWDPGARMFVIFDA